MRGGIVKRVIVVGSPRTSGRSAHLAEMLFEANIDERPEDELFLVPISEIEVGPCVGCNACRAKSEVTFKGEDGVEVTELKNRCIFDDDMQTLYDLLDDADALTIVSPVYFSGAPAPMKCVLDRLQPYFWEFQEKGPRNPKRPLELHVIGEGGDPHGYGALVSEVKGSTALAGFRLERIFDWVGKITEKGEITAEAKEVPVPGMASADAADDTEAPVPEAALADAAEGERNGVSAGPFPESGESGGRQAETLGGRTSSNASRGAGDRPKLSFTSEGARSRKGKSVHGDPHGQHGGRGGASREGGARRDSALGREADSRGGSKRGGSSSRGDMRDDSRAGSKRGGGDPRGGGYRGSGSRGSSPQGASRKNASRGSDSHRNAARGGSRGNAKGKGRHHG